MFGAALPKGIELEKQEVAATFVVPAPNGCNLNCPFCVVRARHESPVGEHFLTAEDYVAFLEGVSGQLNLGLVSIVGHEPLLPESWPCTRKILQSANELQKPTAIITNGTHLAERVNELVELGITGLTVSLDSASPEIHDTIRRTSGAYKQALHGIQAALASPLKDRLLVTSVLQPGKSHYLDDMPQLLQQLGIQEWVVSALFKFNNHDPAGPAESTEKIVTELIRLQDLAARQGIELIVDDEFDGLMQKKQNTSPIHSLKLRRMKRLEQVLRVGPTGAFSIGTQILHKLEDSSPRWFPDTINAATFIKKCIQKQGSGMQQFARQS